MSYNKEKKYLYQIDIERGFGRTRSVLLVGEVYYSNEELKIIIDKCIKRANKLNIDTFTYMCQHYNMEEINYGTKIDLID